MRLLTVVLISALTLSTLRAQPKMSVSSTKLDFGTVVLLDSRALSITIKNDDTIPHFFSGWTGPWTTDFTVGGGFNPKLDPDSSETLTIRFSPKSATANHLHSDSLHLIFPDLVDSTSVQLIGKDHVPMHDTVMIADSFLTMPGKTIIVPQYLTYALDSALDSVRYFSEVISWDPQVLDIKAWNPGAVIQGWVITPTVTIGGQALIHGNAVGHAITGNGEFMRFEFQVLPNAPVISVSSLVQEQITFGAGFEPIMHSIAGRVIVTDSCVPQATEKASLGTTMLQNSPNPFHDATVLTYQIGGPESTNASIRIFDSRGNVVMTPLHGAVTPGLHQLTLERSALSAGVYTGLFEAAGVRELRKIVVAP